MSRSDHSDCPAISAYPIVFGLRLPVFSLKENEQIAKHGTRRYGSARDIPRTDARRYTPMVSSFNLRIWNQAETEGKQDDGSGDQQTWIQAHICRISKSIEQLLMAFSNYHDHIRQWYASGPHTSVHGQQKDRGLTLSAMV